LAHYCLWIRENGEFHIADRLIHAVANDPRAAATHEQTARRYQLYTEIFSDRGSICVTRDVNPVVAGLVKIQTGLSQVSAASYLKQAAEIFAVKSSVTEGVSHPEMFIRARAMQLWQERRHEAEPKISEMIEGNFALDSLDLIGQARLTERTRTLLENFLQPKWFQTPAVLSHAKFFFNNFQPVATPDPSVFDGLKFHDAKLREYFCYLLLDFVTTDPDLDDMPLAAALEFSRQLEMDAQFEKLAAKELKMKIRDMRKIKEQAVEMLAKAEVSG
jgi:hypothetical protein